MVLRSKVSTIARFIFLATSLMILLAVAVSATPQTISLHGKLTDDSNSPLQGTYNINFSLYNVATGGSSLWNQYSSVTTDLNGIYNVELKNIDLEFDEDYYLGIKVGSDSEMSPRINLTSSPYSFTTKGLDAEINITHNVSIDQGTLFIDTTNNRVGIGTTTPLQLLSLNPFTNNQPQLFLSQENNSNTGWAIESNNVGLFKIFRYDSPLVYPASVLSMVYDTGNVGIGTLSPTQKLDVNGSLNITGASGKIYAPEICINGDCQTAWPSVSSSAAGWNNDSTTTNTSLDVNVNGNINVTGNVNANQLCIGGDCNSAWPSSNGGATYFNKTTVTFDGNIGGYGLANSNCSAEFTGTHMCTVQEILDTINTRDVTTITEWTGTAWIAGGPPGYTANANDCKGFTSNTSTYLGKFWDFDDTTDEGIGWMTNCENVKPLACCKVI